MQVNNQAFSVMSSVTYKCPRLLRQSNLVLSVWEDPGFFWTSGGSLRHPGILPWCPLRHRLPCCSEDPLDTLGSSLGVPSDTGPHAVRRTPWTPWDPPLVSPQTQAPMLSGGPLGHPGILPWYPHSHRAPCCPEDPLDIWGSSLGVPSDTVCNTQTQSVEVT